MRSFKILTVLIVFLCTVSFINCSGVSIKDDEATQIIIKTTARVLSYKFIQNNPKYIDGVKIYCKAFEDQEITQAMINGAIEFLSKNIVGDAVLVAALKDLTDLIIIDIDDEKFNPEYIRSAALGFYEGAELVSIDIN